MRSRLRRPWWASPLCGALVLATFLASALVLPTRAQDRPTTSETPLSDRRVSYTMDVRLDAEARTVSGTQRITWRNPDAVPVDELQFHLYLNAFKPGSTFMTESGGRHRGFTSGGEDTAGRVTIDRLTIAPPAGDQAALAYDAAALPEASRDLTGAIRFIQPDDGNPQDSTVVTVTLPRPVQPGETITLETDFTAQLPKIFARTGWEEKPDGSPFFMVAQWFPKLGVYEVPGQRYVPEDAPRGRWNTHQFHANSEFYADFGVYDVTITVPDAYTVGASGLRVDEQAGEATRTVRYRAEDVHDFAWTASPDYLVYEDTWEHVSLRLLLQPEHDGQAERHFTAAKAALERYDAWIGEYPYTTLTLVDAVGGANGMEYPTLITCGTVYMLPEWARFLELVTIHEFGHQYFYGLLASNENEEPWLDEGFTSYVEMRAMDEAYGNGSMFDLPGMPVSDGDFQRLSYTQNNPSRGTIYTYAWKHDFNDYGKVSYAKPATVLMTLEHYLSWEAMQEILRTYYERWRFRHPTTRDFIAIAEEVSGEDLGWFFDQYVYDDKVVDYAVHYLGSSRQEDDTYRSTVIVKRKQDGTFPQLLRVTYDDGTTEDIRWDGLAEWKEFSFDGRVVDAHLDPENAVWLELDRLDNRRAHDDGPLARKMQLKVTVWLQQFLTLAAGLL